MQPTLPIDVDEQTGVWRTDGLPMLYVPRHFFMNNHLAAEGVLGREAYAALLYPAGHKSAYYWCEQESRRHKISGAPVYEHYLRRLSQRGWGIFALDEIDPPHPRAHHAASLRLRAGPARDGRPALLHVLGLVRGRHGLAERPAGRPRAPNAPNTTAVRRGMRTVNSSFVPSTPEAGHALFTPVYAHHPEPSRAAQPHRQHGARRSHRRRTRPARRALPALLRGKGQGRPGAGHLRRLQHRFARQPARLVALGQPFHRPRHRTAGPPGRGHAPPRRAHHDPGDPHGPALVLAWRTLAAPGQPSGVREPCTRATPRPSSRGNPPHHRRLRAAARRRPAWTASRYRPPTST